MNRRTWTRFLCLLLLTIAPAAAVARAELDPGQLPKSTIFYLKWHGTPSGEARKANSLLALWDDPDFAPVRAAMLERMQGKPSSAQKTQTAVTPEEISEYVTLLDNEFVFGYLANPNAANDPETISSSAPMPSTWNGGFFVYDRSGKQALLAKLMLRIRMSEKSVPKMSTTTIAGIPAMKIEQMSGTSYYAEDGQYAFGASEPAVFEQVAAWCKHGKADTGLAQNAAYREAADFLKTGVVQFFFRFPGIREMNWDASPGGFRMRPILQNLRLEAVHAVAGHIILDGARTRMQGAVLGEAEPGTLFDIWSEGTATPYSWNLVNANTTSYHESQINLLGIHALIKHAMQSSVAKQQSPIDFIDATIGSRLGMPIQEALGLFSGEFAGIQTSATLDPAKRVYILGIRKKPETLRLLRAGLGNRIISERSEGTTTFFKASEGGIDSSAGTASWQYYHIGVTNDAILFAKRYESVRETLAPNNSGSSTGKGAQPTSQNWQAFRTQFPAKVNGLSFLDFQKVDWGALKERWQAELHKPSTAANANRKTNTDTQAGAFASALKNLDPEVFARHLHFSGGASWKDAHGLHFDAWIE